MLDISFPSLRPVYTGDFCCDFVAISNRPCKLLAIPRRFESPVVYTGDLKSPRNRSKNRQCNRPKWRGLPYVALVTSEIRTVRQIGKQTDRWSWQLIWTWFLYLYCMIKSQSYLEVFTQVYQATQQNVLHGTGADLRCHGRKESLARYTHTKETTVYTFTLR